MSKLHDQANVPKTGITYTLKHVEQFQQVLLDKYQIIVISSSFFNKPVYTGSAARKKIYLYHHEDHYDLITNISKFYPKNTSMCTVCWEVYRTDKPHYKCTNICRLCNHENCTSVQAENNLWEHCYSCNRYYPSSMCYFNHMKKPRDGLRPVCKTKCQCIDCGQIVPRAL